MTYAQLGDTEKAIADYSAVIDLPQASADHVAMARSNRGNAYWLLGNIEKAKQDLKTALTLEGTSKNIRVDCHLALATTSIATGAWDTGTASLTQGLREGNQQPPSYTGDSTHVINAFFKTGVMPETQQNRASELIGIYQNYDSVSELGEAIIQHLGTLYSQADARPASDTLEAWATAWEGAGKDIDTLGLTLRILRTGIEFLKSKGEDRGILFTLNKEEREILEQTFSLEYEP